MGDDLGVEPRLQIGWENPSYDARLRVAGLVPYFSIIIKKNQLVELNNSESWCFFSQQST